MTDTLLGYVTEPELRKRMKDAFDARLASERQLEQEAKESGRTYKSQYSPGLFETPKYQKWIEDRITSYRKRGLLVTRQQVLDIKHGRKLRENDRVKFVGQTRIDNTRSGRQYTRVTGEEGTIVLAVKGSDDVYVYTYLPKIPAQALEPDGPKVFIARMLFREGTPGYFQLERIPDEGDPVQ